jgi:long-chain acyl-CoA synthetase
MFQERVAESAAAEAFRYREGSAWRSVSWGEAGARVRALALGLRALGLADEQRVAILSGTRIEWILADLAILCAGGATTTIYPSSTAEDCAFILADSGSVVCFAENDAQVARLRAKRGDLPGLARVVVMEGEAAEGDGWVITMADLEALGREADERDPSSYGQIVDRIGPQALATLIYTSGTTGRPKGVELVHDCWLYEGEAIDALRLLRPDDLQYLWLPLAHVFGKVLQAAQIRIGFPTAVDGNVERIVENLAVVRPTFVAAVPRIFEKVHNRIVATAAEGSALRRRIFQWAFRLGRRVAAARRDGRPVAPWTALGHAVADRLVFAKIRGRFGGRLRFFVSGSAPLPREISEFFHAAGILILEGYGLTESSAASFVNLPDRFRFGTVGPALPGTELRIAEDGEILLRSRGIMRGYHGQSEATAEAKDGDGWLHTGDIGVLHPEGFLQITDRKKDLIKTSGGKYVAPQALEGKLKATCRFVSQVVVHGNNRKFCVALVTLETEAVRAWLRERHPTLAEAPVPRLADTPEVRGLVETCIDVVNGELASHETMKRFAVLPDELSVEAGELTPSLKVKRRVVEEKYRRLIDALYG